MTPILEGLRTGAWRLVGGVKPLDWYLDPGAFPYKTWGAQSSFGRFLIEEVSASDTPAYESRYTPHHLIALKDSLDEAKAAAQADYEARILSALTVSPDATAALLAEIEGLRGALEPFAAVPPWANPDAKLLVRVVDSGPFHLYQRDLDRARATAYDWSRPDV